MPRHALKEAVDMPLSAAKVIDVKSAVSEQLL
jgi:hypothetical protein